ncbi:hypothetical protein A7C91_09620 [Thermococcus piezophilus]|uniref:Uncharacterized protein n=1 Tax=Thermococcus piezophilus TaxID=1712654 RepID=A0A172WIV1_9EURY|nr:hypothetical protein A7C91_09620 [Thermococcus piezophilus]
MHQRKVVENNLLVVYFMVYIMWLSMMVAVLMFFGVMAKLFLDASGISDPTRLLLFGQTIRVLEPGMVLSVPGSVQGLFLPVNYICCSSSL